MTDCVIYCPNCLEEREAIRVGQDYRCLMCGVLADEEAASPHNLQDMRYYRQLYRGAKIAGIIPDKDFEGDRW